MPHPEILISVVIPTCARDHELAQCLERLAPARQAGLSLMAPQAMPAESSTLHYEVLVTDDGISPTTEAMLRARFPWARWIQGPRRGPAANRNQGARQARGQWLVFTDDDCLPEADWLGAFAAGMQQATSTGDRVLEGRTEGIGTRPDPLAQCPVNETGGCLWSCNFAIRTDLFRTLGGFDERFPYAAVEDMEFLIRLRKHGLQPRFVPAALVRHPWKRVRYLAARRRQVWSQLLLRSLHPEQRSWVSFAMHCRRVARFYVHELPGGLRDHGWRQVASLPLQIGDQFQTALIFGLHALGRGPVPTRGRSDGQPAAILP